MTQQEAYNETDKLIQKRLREWHLAVNQLPFYGEVLDLQVQKFVQACQEVAVGNLHWRYESVHCPPYQDMPPQNHRVLTVSAALPLNGTLEAKTTSSEKPEKFPSKYEGQRSY